MTHADPPPGDPTAPKPPPRLPMVAWASPGLLRRSAVLAVLGPLFGRFADKRELVAAADRSTVAELGPPQAEDLWVDFVADTGEGFDSTYTVARVASASSLPNPFEPVASRARIETLERGRLLIFGGDQVYPYAAPGAYRLRLQNPWGAALPEGTEGTADHRLYAIPGNHDWYDGLSCFLRVFRKAPTGEKPRRIGAREVVQTRSYFAAPLAHGWWAWGVDFQFTGFLDDAQVGYFREAAAHMGKNQRILLVVPEPAWVQQGAAAAGARRVPGMRAIDILVNTVARAHGHQVRCVVTGDLHHYARYEEPLAGGAPPGASPPRTRHWITCGGGGAHLNGTHDLPESIDGARLGEGFHDLTRGPVLHPSVARSRRLGWNALALLRYSPPAALLTGALAVLLAWTFGGQAQRDLGALEPGCAALGSALGVLGAALFQHPLAVLALLGILAALRGAVDAPSGAVRWIVGVLHGALHVGAAVGLTWVACWLVAAHPRAALGALLAVAGACALVAALRLVAGRPRSLRAGGLGLGALVYGALGLWHHAGPDRAFSFAALALLLPAASVAHALLLGAYLAVMSRFGKHVGPALSLQSIADEKGFLRIHVGPEGLTVFPIRIPKVRRDWRWDQRTRRHELPEGDAGVARLAEPAEPRPIWVPN